MKTLQPKLPPQQQPKSKGMEIEVHQTKAEGRRVWADYTIYEGDTVTNIGQELRMYDLIEFVKTNEMNIGEFITRDQDIDNFYLDPTTFLFDNMDEVVKRYLENGLEVAS